MSVPQVAIFNAARGHEASDRLSIFARSSSVEAGVSPAVPTASKR
jgi:hypothetical protein